MISPRVPCANPETLHPGRFTSRRAGAEVHTAATEPLRLAWHGTAIYAARRSGFAILAADSFGAGVDSNGSRVAIRDQLKVFAHPRLPLAVAIAGIGSLGESTTVEFLGQRIGHAGRWLLDGDSLLTRISDALVPEVRALANDPRWAVAGIEHMQVVVAFIQARSARLATVRISISGDVEAFHAGESQEPLLICPDLPGEMAVKSQPPEDVEPAKLAEHARNWLQSVIDLDKEVNGADGRSTGRPARVFSVSSDGVRELR